MTGLKFIAVCLIGTYIICCVIPFMIDYVLDIIRHIHTIKFLHKTYLNRLSDLKEYHAYMEKCEREYQVRLIHNIIDTEIEMRNNLFRC